MRRGATTCSANTVAAIDEAVAELVDTLVARNGLEGERVLSVTFSVTADLEDQHVQPPAVLVLSATGVGLLVAIPGVYMGNFLHRRALNLKRRVASLGIYLKRFV